MIGAPGSVSEAQQSLGHYTRAVDLLLGALTAQHAAWLVQHHGHAGKGLAANVSNGGCYAGACGDNSALQQELLALHKADLESDFWQSFIARRLGVSAPDTLPHSTTPPAAVAGGEEQPSSVLKQLLLQVLQRTQRTPRAQLSSLGTGAAHMEQYLQQALQLHAALPQQHEPQLQQRQDEQQQQQDEQLSAVLQQGNIVRAAGSEAIAGSSAHGHHGERAGPSQSTAAAAVSNASEITAAQSTQEDELEVQKVRARQVLAGLQGTATDAVSNSRHSQAQVVGDHRLFSLLQCGLFACGLLWLLSRYGPTEPRTSAGKAALALGHRMLAYLPAGSVRAVVLLLMMAMAGYMLAHHAFSRRRLLHFADPALERRYVLSTNASKVAVDAGYHATWLLVGGSMWARLCLQAGCGRALRLLSGSAACAALGCTPHLMWLAGAALLVPLAPMALLLAGRGGFYVRQREALLVGSRVCFAVALLLLYTGTPHLQGAVSVQSIALAQLPLAAGMQVRLSTFLPMQLLHLLSTLATVGAAGLLGHAAQLLGVGLCLPSLLLYLSEVHARRQFLGLRQGPQPQARRALLAKKAA